jgi:translation initiation factor 5B
VKRELAKKEGRLLTKKQKEEKAMAEIRKQALLASGVQIEGLQQASGSGAPAVKKVVYGNRKKKGPTNAAKEASPAPESRPRTPEPVAPVVEPVVEPKAELEDDWEASSAEEETVKSPPAGVKDSWDASSDEEDASSPPPVPASTPAKSTTTKPVAKPAAKSAPVAKKGQ